MVETGDTSGAPTPGRPSLVPAPSRVVVFLDYQNVYRGARRAFHSEHDAHWCGQVDPVKLWQHLANDSPFSRTLTQVRIYRGHPTPRGTPGDTAPAGVSILCGKSLLFCTL